MTYLYNVLPFPAGSRLTGIWSNRDVDPSVADGIASGHLILLPDDQHAEVEGDFLTSHMPFWVAALGGALPDGQPWLFIVQKAPADVSFGLVGADDPAWVLRDSLFRALRFNDGAWLGEELIWSRDDILDVYRWEGIDPESLDSWSMASLLRGLLAECCYVDLGDVVNGLESGCAFPDIEHDCTGDVFSDVFARWATGRMTHPEPADDEAEDWEGAFITESDLTEMSRAELEALAQEFGVRPRRKKTGKKRSRARLIELILEAGGEEVGDA
jgi:hypothetical protein